MTRWIDNTILTFTKNNGADLYLVLHQVLGGTFRLALECDGDLVNDCMFEHSSDALEFIRNMGFDTLILPTYDGEMFAEWKECDVCGDVMVRGYCEDGGCRYYCTDCLPYSKDEWNKMCDLNEGNCYAEWF